MTTLDTGPNGDTDFVGRGWSFPVRIGGAGGIRLASGTEEIDSAIRMIVSTAHGERVMRPDFGCGIWDLLFEPVNPGSLGEMEQAVTEAVQRWEPRVEVASVVAEPDSESPERVNINIEYAIRATNDQRNLVFPFYVIPQEGEE